MASATGRCHAVRSVTILRQESIATVQACGKRMASLDLEGEETAAQTSPVWPVPEAFMAQRGISLLACGDGGRGPGRSHAVCRRDAPTDGVSGPGPRSALSQE
jgi:hypothetical protein